MKPDSCSPHWFASLAIALGAADAYAGTALDPAACGPAIVLTADRLGVTYTSSSVQCVRSDRALEPGSGFFYFEGRRLLGDEGFGFGVATARASLAAYGGSDGQSFGADVSGGMRYAGAFVGSFPFAPNATYGIAVDYRGVHPIAYLIAREVAGGPALVFVRVVLSEIESPLHILVYGSRVASGVHQRINPGNDLAGAGFELDPMAALDAASYRGSEGLVLGWNPAPILRVSIERSVFVIGSTVTAHASAVAPGRTRRRTPTGPGPDLTSAITWSESRGSATGSGGTFTFTPDRLGTYELIARATGREGAWVSARLDVTILRSSAIDSDNDGLSYAEEVAAGTDPGTADSDHDALRDDLELTLSSTDPRDPDTDGDGMSDGWEVRHDLDPRRGDAGADPDGDGFGALAEFLAGTDPRSSRSYPGHGTVLLSATDKHPSVALSPDRLGATFTAPGTHGVRSDVAVLPGSGWYYFEGHRASAPGSSGFGVASATAPLDAAGGSSDQSLGVLATGALIYAGQQAGSFADPDAVEWYGFALDYSGTTPKVHLIVDRPGGAPQVLPPVPLTGITTAVHILVFGQPATAGVLTINAGADPVQRPFHHPAAYLVHLAGYPGAEFMGSGFGPAHAHAGRPESARRDPVVLVPDVQTNPEVVLARDGLGASYGAYQKSAVRANQAMIGEFRYFETHREVGPVNIGQGLINPWADLDPYCCVSSDANNAPPSMSMNSTGSVWQNLVWQASFPRENETYGFAVDYRGARPIVHCIVGGQLVETSHLSDFITPIVPMLYGDPAGPVLVNTINFGTKPFQYDPEAVLAAAGVDASELVRGWGDANRPSASQNVRSRVSITNVPVEVTLGEPIAATALARDVDQGDIGAFIEWSESEGPARGTGTHFVFTPTTPGVHQLRAEVTDSLGSTARAVASIRVSPGSRRLSLYSPP